MTVNPALTTLRGLLVYTAIAATSLTIWAAVIIIVYRYGWPGAAAITATLLSVYEVVFAWPGDPDRTA